MDKEKTEVGAVITEAEFLKDLRETVLYLLKIMYEYENQELLEEE